MQTENKAPCDDGCCMVKLNHAQGEIIRGLVDIISTITLNAEVIADPRMNNTTECYAVPLDDIDKGRQAIAKFRRA